MLEGMPLDEVAIYAGLPWGGSVVVAVVDGTKYQRASTRLIDVFLDRLDRCLDRDSLRRVLRVELPHSLRLVLRSVPARQEGAVEVVLELEHPIRLSGGEHLRSNFTDDTTGIHSEVDPIRWTK